jgi:N-methylhydantoinase A
VANIEHEEVASFKAACNTVDPKEIIQVYSRLETLCEQKRKGVGIQATRLRVDRSAEMRYIGQSYELEVPFPEGIGEITTESILDIVGRFHKIHQNIYQHSAADSPVEFQALRMVYWQEPEIAPRLNQPAASDCVADPKCHRCAYFDEYQDFIDTPVYERNALVPGQKLTGPAIVEQVDTTTVIYPGQRATVDMWGNLIMINAG